MKSKSYDRRIYPMTGLPPEVVAVTFAKTSRVPHQFSEIAKELSDEESSKFHEKWVIGYGHSSVAEHAVLSLALENVSILATKVIEDNRLASYTEQSTRYQYYDRDRYYRPSNLPEEVLKHYLEAADLLMGTYCELMASMESYMKSRYPREANIGEQIYTSQIRSKSCDVLRYLLPTATLTNLGWTVNARVLEYAITKLKTHRLTEMNSIGDELKLAAKKITPILLKYADKSGYMSELDCVMSDVVKNMKFQESENGPSVTLEHYDKEAEEKVIASLLYRYSHINYKDAFGKASEMTTEERSEILETVLGSLGKHDRPPRELEHISYTFDILMDYGAFRDIQRHRLCTQTGQLVTTAHGYDIPEEIADAGFRNEYLKCMEKSDSAFRKIERDFPLEAQYVVALAYKKRTLFTMNLREAHHIIKLRTSPAGHRSYRVIAHLIAEAIKKVHPVFSKYITDCYAGTGQED